MSREPENMVPNSFLSVVTYNMPMKDIWIVRMFSE